MKFLKVSSNLPKPGVLLIGQTHSIAKSFVDNVSVAINPGDDFEEVTTIQIEPPLGQYLDRCEIEFMSENKKKKLDMEFLLFKNLEKDIEGNAISGEIIEKMKKEYNLKYAVVFWDPKSTKNDLFRELYKLWNGIGVPFILVLTNLRKEGLFPSDVYQKQLFSTFQKTMATRAFINIIDVHPFFAYDKKSKKDFDTDRLTVNIVQRISTSLTLDVSWFDDEEPRVSTSASPTKPVPQKQTEKSIPTKPDIEKPVKSSQGHATPFHAPQKPETSHPKKSDPQEPKVETPPKIPVTQDPEKETIILEKQLFEARKVSLIAELFPSESNILHAMQYHSDFVRNTLGDNKVIFDQMMDEIYDIIETMPK